MKTREEIEKLATKNYRSNGSGGGQYTEGLQDGRKIGFVDGYTKCQEDIKQKLYEFGKLVLDTFHSEGRTHSGKERLPRVKFDEWFNELNKQD
jgi:flagellar biosynthesis/type III secretory pathway protein FliH